VRLRFFENVRFCPKCGVDALDRDYYHQAEPRPGGGGETGRKQIGSGTEWVCRICGFSFRIDKSVRWQQADELQRRDRQQRVGKPSDGTTEEIRDAHVAHIEHCATQKRNRGHTNG
jgi:rubredoxin